MCFNTSTFAQGEAAWKPRWMVSDDEEPVAGQTVRAGQDKKKACRIPLVFSKENTAKGYPRIEMKAFEDLPSQPGLPDPFAWADGSGRSTDFKDWERHRSEIMQMLYHYEIGKSLR